MKTDLFEKQTDKPNPTLKDWWNHLSGLKAFEWFWTNTAFNLLSFLKEEINHSVGSEAGNMITHTCLVHPACR